MRRRFVDFASTRSLSHTRDFKPSSLSPLPQEYLCRLKRCLTGYLDNSISMVRPGLTCSTVASRVAPNKWRLFGRPLTRLSASSASPRHPGFTEDYVAGDWASSLKSLLLVSLSDCCDEVSHSLPNVWIRSDDIGFASYADALLLASLSDCCLTFR